MSSTRTWFLSAGEHSGDLLASDLMAATAKLDSNIAFFGLGGGSMVSQGAEIIVPMSQLNTMGLIEVFSKLVDLVKAEQKIVDEVNKRGPEICILVDFPGFHLRLAKRLSQQGYRVVQYVAPKVWAWNQKRVKDLQKNFGLVLGVLPFETNFFVDHGVNYKYVGSPHRDRIEGIAPVIQGLEARPNERYISILPGSRESEIIRIVPEILKIVELFEVQEENCRFLIPIAESLDPAFVISKFVPNFKGISGNLIGPHVEGSFIFIRGQSLQALKLSRVALVTSGTVTLECGLIGTPMIVLYKMNTISYILARFLVKIRWISLVNLTEDKSIVSEYIQRFPYSEIANELRSLIEDTEMRKAQISQLREMGERYFGGASMSVARELFSSLNK